MHVVVMTSQTLKQYNNYHTLQDILFFAVTRQTSMSHDHLVSLDSQMICLREMSITRTFVLNKLRRESVFID